MAPTFSREMAAAMNSVVPTGGVNKAFGGLYKVRLKAKALRERSVVAYQVIKWGLVVAVIAGIWAL